MQFKHKLSYITLGGVFMVVGLLGMTSISLAQGETWTYKTPMPTARGFLSGTVLDGKIYVVGGADNPQLNAIALVEMYDPVSDTWTTRASMPEARTCPATCTYNGKMYVFGGASPMLSSPAKNTVFEYDPQTDTWTQKANMPHAFRSCGVAVLNDTIYLMGGGSVYFPPDSTVMAYHPLTESWIEKEPMPTARGSLSACVVDGQIYAIGGTTDDYHSVSYKLVEVFDPATNTWTQKADMPTGRFGLEACAFDGKIYAVGGWRGSDVLTINEMYDPATNGWESKSGLQQKRFTLFLGSVGAKIYAIGGAYPQGTQAMLLSSVEEYNPAYHTDIQTGNVSGTWTLANSPYHINGEITIPNGETLIIEPGVEVIFQGHYKFNVQGRILSIGTEQDSIIFTADDHSAGWHGLRFDNTPSSNDSSIIEYCRLEYGKANTGSGDADRCGGAILVRCYKLRISHCLFQLNMCYSTNIQETGGGAIAIASGNPIISHCEFKTNTSAFFGGALLIWFSSSKGQIVNNYIHHSTGHGTITIGLGASPILYNNLIVNNHSIGHGVIHISDPPGMSVFINNTIVSNTCSGAGGAVFVNHGLRPLFINNIIYGNTPAQVRLEAPSGPDFINCLIEGGEEGFSGASFTGIYQNNIDNDPMFVDAANDDYNLSDTSPCISSGTDSVEVSGTWYYAPSLDIDGNPRPNPPGTIPDIGAFENILGNSATGIQNGLNRVPHQFQLYLNYPNPFNPTTSIQYKLPSNEDVTIRVYNSVGQEVDRLVDKRQEADYYTIQWDGSEQASGIYVLRFKAGEYQKNMKMILLK